MNFHKFFNAEALKGRDNGLVLSLHEDGVKSVLVTDRLEDVELDQREAVPLAIFKLLKELRLGLVVQVGVLCVLYILKPNSRVNDLGVRLHRATHALID